MKVQYIETVDDYLKCKDLLTMLLKFKLSEYGHYGYFADQLGGYKWMWVSRTIYTALRKKGPPNKISRVE